jgi:hypothetical protein
MQAGAAEIRIFFNESGFQAVLSGADSGRIARRPAANYSDVINGFWQSRAPQLSMDEPRQTNDSRPAGGFEGQPEMPIWELAMLSPPTHTCFRNCSGHAFVSVGSSKLSPAGEWNPMPLFAFFFFPPIFGFGLILAFLPAIIAFARSKRDALSILVLNFFLGWTVIGWVIALVWALKQDVPMAIR